MKVVTPSIRLDGTKANATQWARRRSVIGDDDAPAEVTAIAPTEPSLGGPATLTDPERQTAIAQAAVITISTV
jgi:hypothetical protein